ncbi:MAG: four helix bundle protein [Candidatus Sungbacteria bacterium]|uniref:Four helix bundle protein n=1 Tax=Candidatus Sungiibacteriota bacterium TaxID=2750080 RepID=A0A9D6LN72_9BACT|nr:four helix bundle protein [Candidatus Sungbacteria bacterium]
MNSEAQNSKRYDLEPRTLEFAKKVRTFVKKLPHTLGNIEDGKQLVRSSGSIGANYIEANESLSKRDFFMRVKISRKESKECRYWLMLVEPHSKDFAERDTLIQEATEFMKMFGSMLGKAK